MIVLYIDDDGDDRSYFCDGLKSFSDAAVCLTASDGEEAMDILRGTTPDYIFLDQNMPGMNGREVLKMIRSDAAFDSVSVIMYSTSYQQDDVGNLTSEGAARCVLKPTSTKALN